MCPRYRVCGVPINKLALFIDLPLAIGIDAVFNEIVGCVDTQINRARSLRWLRLLCAPRLFNPQILNPNVFLDLTCLARPRSNTGNSREIDYPETRSFTSLAKARLTNANYNVPRASQGVISATTISKTHWHSNNDSHNCRSSS